MKKQGIMIICAMIISILLVSGCGGAVNLSTKSNTMPRYEAGPTSLKLGAEYTEVAPNIDGVVSEITDEAWSNAAPVEVKIDETNIVELKAAYDDNCVYLLATWADDEANYGGKPWEVRAEQGFKSGTNLPKQDMLAFGFETSPIKDFDKQSCAIVCHDNAYMGTNSPGEFLDVWSWMAAETGLTGTANNYIVGNIPADVDGKEFTTAGYHYINGSLIANKRNARSPEWMQKPTIPYAQMLFGDIAQMVTVPEDATKLPEGFKVPYYIKSPGTGDVICSATYNAETKKWTAEFKRALTTINPTQIQFAHKLENEAAYLFGLSLFNNQKGVSHVYFAEAISLEFTGK